MKPRHCHSVSLPANYYVINNPQTPNEGLGDPPKKTAMIAHFASNSKQHRDQRPRSAFNRPSGLHQGTQATHPYHTSQHASKSREEAHDRGKGSRWQGARREERGRQEDCCACGRQEEAIEDSKGNLLFLYL